MPALHRHSESCRENPRPQPQPQDILAGEAKSTASRQLPLLDPMPGRRGTLWLLPELLRGEQQEVSGTARVLPQVDPCHSQLTVPPMTPTRQKKIISTAHIPHRLLLSPQSKRQNKVGSAGGGRAGRKGRCCGPTPVKRINSCFRNMGADEPQSSQGLCSLQALGKGLFIRPVDSEPHRPRQRCFSLGP